METGKKYTAHTSVDSFIHARQARFTMNLSPVTRLLAFLDWFLNLADSPGTQYRILDDFTGMTENEVFDFLRVHQI